MTRKAVFDKVMRRHHLRSKEEHESAGLVCLIIEKIGSKLVPPPGPGPHGGSDITEGTASGRQASPSPLCLQQAHRRTAQAVTAGTGLMKAPLTDEDFRKEIAREHSKRKFPRVARAHRKKPTAVGPDRKLRGARFCAGARRRGCWPRRRSGRGPRGMAAYRVRPSTTGAAQVSVTWAKVELGPAGTSTLREEGEALRRLDVAAPELDRIAVGIATEAQRPALRAALPLALREWQLGAEACSPPTTCA